MPPRKSEAFEPAGHDVTGKIQDRRHELGVDPLEQDTGDPRAGDPEWIYLEVLSNTVMLPGPSVPAAGLDLTAIRAEQEWDFAGFEGTDDDFTLQAGDRLEYGVTTPGTSAVLLIALEAEICLVGDQVTAAFWFAAGDTPAVVESVTVEVRVMGNVVGQTAPVTIEIGAAG